MNINGNIEEILNGDGDYSSILTSSLLFKIAAALNGLGDAFDNISSQRITSSTIWTTPPSEICWLIAIGSGGGGGGGGAGPINVSGASIGDAGSDGQDGGISSFNSIEIGSAGEGGKGGVLGTSSLSQTSDPYCERNMYTLMSGSSVPNAGKGAYVADKDHMRNGFSGHDGIGGQTGSYGLSVFKDLNANTGYELIIGSGGGGGANHPALASQVVSSGTFAKKLFNSTAGSSGDMILIYSGY